MTVHHIEDDPADGQPRYYVVSGGLTATHDFNWIKHVIREKGFNCTLTDHTEVSTKYLPGLTLKLILNIKYTGTWCLGSNGSNQQRSDPLSG